MENIILDKLHKEEIEILNEIVRVCNDNNIEYFLIGGTLLGAIRHKGFIPWDDDLDIAMPRRDYEKFLNIANKKLNPKYTLEYFKNVKKSYIPFAKVKNINTIYEEAILENYDGSKGIWVDIFPLDFSKKDSGIKWKTKGKLIKTLKKVAMIKYGNYNKNNILKNIIYYCFPKSIIMGLLNNLMKANRNEKSKYFINFGSQYGIKKQTHIKEEYLPSVYVEFEGEMYKAPRNYDYVLRKIYGNNYMQLPPVEKRVTHNPIRIKFEDGEEVKFEDE